MENPDHSVARQHLITVLSNELVAAKLTIALERISHAIAKLQQRALQQAVSKWKFITALEGNSSFSEQAVALQRRRCHLESAQRSVALHQIDRAIRRSERSKLAKAFYRLAEVSREARTSKVVHRSLVKLRVCMDRLVATQEENKTLQRELTRSKTVCGLLLAFTRWKNMSRDRAVGEQIGAMVRHKRALMLSLQKVELRVDSILRATVQLQGRQDAAMVQSSQALHGLVSAASTTAALAAEAFT